MTHARSTDHFIAIDAATSKLYRALADLIEAIDNLRLAEDRNPPRTHYSLEEAADALGVSRSTLRRRLRDGTVRSVKIGGRRLIPVHQPLLLGVLQ